MRRFLQALVASLALTASASLARASCSVGVVPLPVTVQGTRPIVEAAIDGQPVRMLIDSGAFFSIISPAVADTLRLHRQPIFGLTVSGVGGEASVDEARTKTFELAGSTLRGVVFLVGGGEAGADGIIGQNILPALGDVDYDLAHGLVRLVRPRGCEHANMAYWDKAGSNSEIELLPPQGRTKFTLAYAQIDGRRAKVLFDTGAAQSYLTESFARTLGFSPDGPGVVDAGYSHGVGRRPVKTWIMPIDSFAIGREEVQHTRLRVGAQKLEEADMLLGADFFLSHHIYVANTMRRLFFTYNGGPVFDLRRGEPQSAPAQATAAAADGAPEPADADAFARRGAAFLGRGETAQAIADLTRAHELAPGEAAYLFRRGQAQERAGHPALARADYDAALHLDADDVDALAARARLRLEAHDRPGAIADLDAVDRLTAERADVRFDLARLYAQARAFGPAARQYGLWARAHEQDARFVRAQAGRCWTGALSGDDLAAIMAACESALRRAPNDDQALAGRGVARLRQGDAARARADFDAALAQAPKAALVLYARSLAERRLGDAPAADRDLAAAQAARPGVLDEVRGLRL